MREIKAAPKVYDDTLTQNKAPYIVDAVVNQLQAKYPDIRSGGYRIDTAVDLEYQAMARKALKFGYDAYWKRHASDDNISETFNGAMVVLDGRSGDILAMLGGVDYTQSPFNRAVSSRRQPGSAFKPFIYETALNLGYNPESRVPDIARTYRFDEGDTEKLFFGIRDLPYNLSIALGNIALSPLQMARLYTVFADMGTLHEPRLVVAVYDDSGKMVEHIESRSKEVYAKPQAYLLVDMLRDVVKRGTGRNARVPGLDVAGKTGTTNNSVDTWFCSFTPDIETIVWFGNDDNTPLPKRETGGRTAAPVTRVFYQALVRKHPEYKRKFEEPEGVYHAERNGRDALYTDLSPLPAEEAAPVDEEIIF